MLVKDIPRFSFRFSRERDCSRAHAVPHDVEAKGVGPMCLMFECTEYFACRLITRAFKMADILLRYR